MNTFPSDFPVETQTSALVASAGRGYVFLPNDALADSSKWYIYIYIYMKRFLSFNAFYPLKRLTYTCVFRIWYSPHSAALYNILFLFSHPHYTRYQVR